MAYLSVERCKEMTGNDLLASWIKDFTLENSEIKGKIDDNEYPLCFIVNDLDGYAKSLAHAIIQSAEPLLEKQKVAQLANMIMDMQRRASE